MSKTIFIYGFCATSLMLVLVFQNCGNDYLRRPAPAVASSGAGQGGFFCAESGPSFSTPINLLFVIDMSLSNLGGTLSYQVSPSGTDTHRHTLGAFYRDAVLGSPTVPLSGFDLNRVINPFPNTVAKANSIIVTDRDGNRFEAMRKFIDASSLCAAPGTNFKFSTFGFGDNYMTPKNMPETCESPFQEKAVFSQQIDGLKKYQDDDLNPNKKVRWGGPESPYSMGSTNYVQGLRCMEQKLKRDVVMNSEALPYYHVIFMSDGMPTDKYDPCANSLGFPLPACVAALDPPVRACYSLPLADKYKCLNQYTIPTLLKNLKKEITQSVSGFRFQPVFYWPAGQASADEAQALAVMNPLASIGDVPGVIKLDNVASMLNLQSQICSTISSSIKLNYTIQNFMAVNLTARIRNGVLSADSDMDGLPDEVEIPLPGFNKKKARSKTNGKILDGICDMIGPAACAALPSCDPTVNKGLGFNECDVAVLSAHAGISVNGGDSDNDDLLDLVEFIKKGNLAVKDANDVRITTDSLTVRHVIAQGYDLESDNRAIAPDDNRLMRARFDYVKGSPHCGGGREEVQVVFDNIPVVPVGKFVDTTPGAFNLSHDENENIILLTYKAAPIGGGSATDKVYAMILHVTLDGKIKETITAGDFGLVAP